MPFDDKRAPWPRFTLFHGGFRVRIALTRPTARKLSLPHCGVPTYGTMHCGSGARTAQTIALTTLLVTAASATQEAALPWSFDTLSKRRTIAPDSGRGATMSDSAREIVLGTGNAKKAAEARELLAPFGWTVKTLADFPTAPEIVEDGETFAANAAIKAIKTAQHYNRFGMGEDSGLMVDALKGAPGIYSARYSGENATDQSNNEKLMQELTDVPDAKRSAGYVCSVAIASPDGEVVLAVEGTCRGRIIREARGTNGFGYDPYFLLPEYHRTFGELGSVVKRRISHRARAFTKLIPLLDGIDAG